MALSQRLVMKQGQSLVMTPQLQQAIKLLQLSTLELQQEIQQALESNPMLEMMEEGEAPDDDLRWVRSENEGGGQIAARYLLETGRKHPVFIGARASQQRQFGERYDGFAEELRKAGLSAPAIEVDESLSREEQGVEAVRTLLQSGQPFDGIFAACDLTALGVLRALSESGISVPERVWVIGFDGIRAGNYSSPPLTTIEPDFEQAGDLLVQNVLNRIVGEPLTHRRVPVQLVRRGS